VIHHVWPDHAVWLEQKARRGKILSRLRTLICDTNNLFDSNKLLAGWKVKRIENQLTLRRHKKQR
jgi:hypothetical protein